MRVLFLLPGEGGGGGSHSVVQEAGGLTRLGVEAAIATGAATREQFGWHYPELEEHAVKVLPFDTAADLTRPAGRL